MTLTNDVQGCFSLVYVQSLPGIYNRGAGELFPVVIPFGILEKVLAGLRPGRIHLIRPNARRVGGERAHLMHSGLTNG
jgi:hypothetical protein